MQLSIDIGLGIYGEGRWLSRWSIVSGYPRCVSNPLSVVSSSPELLAATIAVNRAVAEVISAAEMVEAAERATAHPAPPELTVSIGLEGEEVTTENPAYKAWMAASAWLDVASGDDDLQHLLRTRRGELDDLEEGWELNLPALPSFDPYTKTADIIDGEWTVRNLTADELEVWPIRRPPVPSTVSRVQLRLALADRGLLETIDGAVAYSGDTVLVERWGAAIMERGSQYLATMATSLGLSAADVDDIFREASAL